MSINQKRCRSCNENKLKLFLDLGYTPLADRFLTAEQLKTKEPTYPLQVANCENCGLVQILETVKPEVLFCDNYPYYSSFSPALIRHSRENVLDVIESRRLDKNSFVIEVASNDGYLLKTYVDNGVPCLGIDPAEGPDRAAKNNGIPTLCEFFTAELAETLRSEGKAADVIHANNVLAHVADTNGFVEGLSIVLKDSGVAIIEVPYVKDLIDHVEFDTIYHEHLCYFSVTAADALFQRHGLYINNIRKLPIHGGSIRLYVGKQETVSNTVRRMMETEKREKVDQFSYYEAFSKQVEALKSDLLNLLNKLHKDGNKIVAYGAGAKGSTLLNYMGIGRDLVDYVVDRNTHKHGLYMPGMHIPIRSTKCLVEEMPDYVLLLAWNFVEEIVDQQREYQAKGGRFISPVPEPKVL